MQAMRWLRFLLVLFGCSVAADTLTVATWNLHDFPSGVHNLRRPDVEPTNTATAASTIRSVDPDVVLLQEVRDSAACQALIAALQPLKYSLLVCSAFRDGAGIATFQQQAIISKLPADTSGWKKWATFGPIDPPRGFAFAIVQFGHKHVLFYSLHLKSNLADRGDQDRGTQLNILKRELAVEQLLTDADARTQRALGTAIVIGGDFNTNADDLAFVSEKTLSALEGAGYGSCFHGIKQSDRITCPGKGRYADATFDYVFAKGAGFAGEPMVVNSSLSDHRAILAKLVLKVLR